MNWEVEYCDEAKKDIKKLDGSQIKQVLKAIEKGSRRVAVGKFSKTSHA